MTEAQYFSEYENLEIHELMLKDKPRQDAYYKAIMENKSLFKDKVVLDVGAGTGILSILCAKAGAKLVYAVEASNLASLAIEIVQENQLTPIVKVIQSKIESFELPSEIAKVDILVSEWMGFYLLHEGMLDSVIFARDKFLKPNGRMFPETASIYVAPCSVPSRFDFWENVNGVKMTKFGERLRIQKSKNPDIINLTKNDLLHEGVIMTWLDLKTVTETDLDEINFKEVIAVQKDGKYQGVCIWFECQFPEGESEDPTVLSTSPVMPPTHWKQCVIVLPESSCEFVGVGEPLAFSLTMRRNNDDKRKYNIEMDLLDQEQIDHPLPCDCILTKCILTKAHLNAMETDQ